MANGDAGASPRETKAAETAEAQAPGAAGDVAADAKAQPATKPIAFANDGSFMEKFMEMQKAKKAEAEAAKTDEKQRAADAEVRGGSRAPQTRAVLDAAAVMLPCGWVGVLQVPARACGERGAPPHPPHPPPCVCLRAQVAYAYCGRTVHAMMHMRMGAQAKRKADGKAGRVERKKAKKSKDEEDADARDRAPRPAHNGGARFGRAPAPLQRLPTPRICHLPPAELKKSRCPQVGAIAPPGKHAALIAWRFPGLMQVDPGFAMYMKEVEKYKAQSCKEYTGCAIVK